MFNLFTTFSMLYQYNSFRIEFREIYKMNYEISSVYEFKIRLIT